jgi:ribosomal protein L24
MKRATKGKGFVEKTHPIHISNVAYYDTETNSHLRFVLLLMQKEIEKDKLKKQDVS